MDREHERDVFQQEIQKLEQQLKSPQKLQLGSDQRNQEVTGGKLSFSARGQICVSDDYRATGRVEFSLLA